MNNKSKIDSIVEKTARIKGYFEGVRITTVVKLDHSDDELRDLHELIVDIKTIQRFATGFYKELETSDEADN